MLDRDWLASAVRDACDRTVDLVADLDDEALVGPLLPVVNPLIWEIGHLAWFEEKFVLRQACGEEPILPYGDAVYDSGAIPHDTRWRLVLPSRGDTMAYMHEVAERVAARVLAADATDVVCHFALYSVFHYDWHTEAITYTRQTLGHPAPKISGPPGDGGQGHRGQAEAGPLDGDVEISGATFLLGATRGAPFAYDNEKWAHPVRVAPFAMARAAVTQGQYLAFVEDGGYQRPEVWHSDGWAWRQAVGAEQPLYWQRFPGGGWQRRHFDQWVTLEPHRPVVHVNWYEADAYARWAGRRLPTEAEWELVAGGEPHAPLASAGEPSAAGGEPPAAASRTRRYPWGDQDPVPGQANVDWLAMDTTDVAAHPQTDSAFGCRQLVGNVWEWTSTTFGPYPNFERDAYHENSEQFFGSRKVLRGGSWATRSRLLRTTLRNYFTPERRDVFAGFRTCAVDL
jgi:iron(II)-dependent oxidoreductase